MDERTALAARALGLIDLTDLGDHCTPEAIRALCDRADGPFGRTAAVCIWPAFVAQAAVLLRHSSIAVATVVSTIKSSMRFKVNWRRILRILSMSKT